MNFFSFENLILILGDKTAFFIYGLLSGALLGFSVSFTLYKHLLKKQVFQPLNKVFVNVKCIAYSSLKTRINLSYKNGVVCDVKCHFLYEKRCKKLDGNYCIYLKPTQLKHSSTHLKINQEISRLTNK